MPAYNTLVETPLSLIALLVCFCCVALQVDKAASVRRQLLELLSAAVAARPTAAVLGASAACLTALAGDEQVQVARQAAIAAHGVLQAGFALRVGAPQVRNRCDHCLQRGHQPEL